jgi:hypothetical protein
VSALRAGDALILHERCVHRSYFAAAMTKARYATETWFFAPDKIKDNDRYYYI